jgi:hypothetical protein
MASYEVLLLAQMAEEARIAAKLVRHPSLRGAVLVVSAKYAVMAAKAAIDEERRSSSYYDPKAK